MGRLFSRRTALVVAFGVGFVGILFLYFPVQPLELAVQNEINQRLPGPVKLTQLSFDSLLRYEGNAVGNFRGETLSAPFQLRLNPGWSRFGLTIVSPPDTAREDAYPFTATVQVYERTFSGEAQQYPLERVLSNQPGTITGRINGSMRDTPNGDFQFSATAPKLIESPVYPPFFHGLRINELAVKGSLKGRRITLNSIDLTSDKFLLNGSANLTLERPFGQSRVNLDITVEQPLQRTINQSFTLGNFGY